MSKTLNKVIPYQTKVLPLAGSSLDEAEKKARYIFKEIKRKTKRNPYIRSVYFNKQKVFFDYFWVHSKQKARRSRLERLKLFPLALELIKYSRNAPISKDNPNNRNEILHRFAGLTKEKKLFYVQIKEDKRRNHKYFMSVFFWGKSR